jgi:hypothetical protein
MYRGPYPSVWAMLLVHRHPDNKATAPKLLMSSQTIYPRSKVDTNSRWLLEWSKLNVPASLLTDMDCAGFKDNTCLVQCEEGDLVIECE